MKRKIILSVIVSILLLNLVSAANAPGVIQDSFEDKTGINPDTLRDPEQLKEEYLKKNWAELISKNRILGPIHNFLLKISSVFRVVFGEHYSLSIVFLFTIIIWIIVLRIAYVAMQMGPFNNLTNLALALGWTIILAQLRLLKLISEGLVALILSKEAWWARLIIILVIVVVIFMINYGAKLISQMEKKAKQQGRELTLKQKVEETAAFLKGVKKGQEITKK